jgi:ubiquinone/menaquinone biosynthesis C-methylase UbiE
MTEERSVAARSQSSPEEIWRRYDAMEARLTAPLSRRMLDLGGVGPGMRVLDLATGRGEPAIPAAHRVGAAGVVLGVDLSESMLKMARERAAAEGVTNLELRVMNASSLDGIPPSSFDVTLARWALMYLDSPQEALAGAHRALVAGGRLVAAVMAEPERVSYHHWPRRLLEKYRPLPAIDTAAPGPFRYADPDRLPRDLRRAGFTVEQVEELSVPVMEAETADELIAWVRAFGLNRLLDGVPEQMQRSWEADVAREAEGLRQDGLLRLFSVTRIVVAVANRGA